MFVRLAWAIAAVGLVVISANALRARPPENRIDFSDEPVTFSMPGWDAPADANIGDTRRILVYRTEGCTLRVDRRPTEEIARPTGEPAWESRIDHTDAGVWRDEEDERRVSTVQVRRDDRVAELRFDGCDDSTIVEILAAARLGDGATPIR